MVRSTSPVGALPGGVAGLRQIREIDGGYELPTVESEHGGIYGTTLLFQQVLVAERVVPGMRLLSLQTLFVDGGVSGRPVTVEVDRLRSGRSFAFVTLTFRQDKRLITRAEAMLTGDEADYVRHESPPPTPAQTTGWEHRDSAHWPGDGRAAPDDGPGGYRTALTLPRPVTDATTARGLLALATEPEMLLTMTDLLNLGDAPPGGIRGNVLSHTLTFVEPPEPLDGVVVHTRPTYAGRWRLHASGRITGLDGRLLATFSSTGVLRAPRTTSTA